MALDPYQEAYYRAYKPEEPVVETVDPRLAIAARELLQRAQMPQEINQLLNPTTPQDFSGLETSGRRLGALAALPFVGPIGSTAILGGPGKAGATIGAGARAFGAGIAGLEQLGEQAIQAMQAPMTEAVRGYYGVPKVYPPAPPATAGAVPSATTSPRPVAPIPVTAGTPGFEQIQQELDRKLTENQRQASLDDIQFSVGKGQPMKSYLRTGVSPEEQALIAAGGLGQIEEAPGFTKSFQPSPGGGGVSMLTPTADQAAQLRQKDLVRDLTTKKLELEMARASMTPQQVAQLAQKQTMSPVEQAIQAKAFQDYRVAQRKGAAQLAQLESVNLPEQQKADKRREIREQLQNELDNALALRRGTPSKAFGDQSLIQ